MRPVAEAHLKVLIQIISRLLDIVVMVAEVAAHAVAADGLPVAEFDMAVIEFEVDAAIVRN